MPLPAEPLSRRVALAGAAAATAATLAGCTSGPASPAPPGDAGRPAGTNISTAPPGPDVALAARLLSLEQLILARVAAVRRRHPGLADVLAQTQATHRAHARLLRRAVPHPATLAPGPSRDRVRASGAAALEALADQERHLGALQRSLALQARSGTFARVVAAMAAASAQQVEHLSTAATRARR